MNKSDFEKDFTIPFLKEQGLDVTIPQLQGLVGSELIKSLLNNTHARNNEVLDCLRRLIKENFCISHIQQKEWMEANLSPNVLGNIAMKQGLYDTALKNFESVECISNDQLGTVKNNIGVIYNLQGDYDQSVQHLLEAIELSLEDKNLLFTFKNNLASSYRNGGEINKDIALYNHSIFLCDEIIADAPREKSYYKSIRLGMSTKIRSMLGILKLITAEKNQYVKEQQFEKAAGTRDREKKHIEEINEQKLLYFKYLDEYICSNSIFYKTQILLKIISSLPNLPDIYKVYVDEIVAHMEQGDEKTLYNKQCAVVSHFINAGEFKNGLYYIDKILERYINQSVQDSEKLSGLYNYKLNLHILTLNPIEAIKTLESMKIFYSENQGLFQDTITAFTKLCEGCVEENINPKHLNAISEFIRNVFVIKIRNLITSENGDICKNLILKNLANLKELGIDISQYYNQDFINSLSDL